MLSDLFSSKATENQRIGGGLYGFLSMIFGGVNATGGQKFAPSVQGPLGP